jgi:MazG family protein
VATQSSVNFTPTFAALLELIDTLRSERGCPWDRKQTPVSASVYLIEEVFELVEAIVADDTAAIQEEMGDALFQVLFLMNLYREAGRFEPTDVLGQNIKKMIHRHPHVFGTDKVESAEQVKVRWREIKQQEKGAGKDSVLDSVPTGLPSLMRAYRISERAAAIGFDWDHLAGVVSQAEAEWREFKDELNTPEGSATEAKDRLAEELGDVLFTLVNVARLAGIHPDTALTRSTVKFIRRFKQMESRAAAQGQKLEQVSRQEKESLWVAVKAQE